MIATRPPPGSCSRRAPIRCRLRVGRLCQLVARAASSNAAPGRARVAIPHGSELEASVISVKDEAIRRPHRGAAGRDRRHLGRAPARSPSTRSAARSRFSAAAALEHALPAHRLDRPAHLWRPVRRSSAASGRRRDLAARRRPRSIPSSSTRFIRSRAIASGSTATSAPTPSRRGLSRWHDPPGHSHPGQAAPHPD